MLNKLQSLIRQYDMLAPGQRVFCAVSGGADSMALLWSLYLLREKLQISLSAAHFNHGLRGEESDRDEAFVRDFCAGYGIDFVCGRAQVTANAKGLEAAARDARYAFLENLPGKIATAHTADDNAETVLMHLVRGTGLKGLGGITPVRGSLIRPMLTVTRREVLAFLAEYSIPYVTDSSNETDDFLRNRLRHHVMPLLQQENPRLAENLSAMAQQLRLDEQALRDLAGESTPTVTALRQMPPAVQSRALAQLLQRSGVREPERAHMDLARSLVYSDNPSARAQFPGGVTLSRSYDTLTAQQESQDWEPVELPVPGTVELHGYRITCALTDETHRHYDHVTVTPAGTIYLRPRQPGDTMRLTGGTKSLKKLFIDQKIPARERLQIPVLADDEGVLAVCGIGANLDRVTPGGVEIKIQKMRERKREDFSHA